ncbi:MAG: FAD-binding oxidoreductase, partial [Bacteroidetes bacterium]|nr:FAD-binding oxidoreductase [Bacteroidota bacterium]
MSRIVVVGGGIFGLTAADELTGRGWDVTVIERGTVPDPLAASTDISKVIRMEYGADREYMALGEKAIEGWHRWNDMFADAFGEVVYHETGVAMFCMESMRGGG